MCFSASASFLASGALAITGVASQRKAGAGTRLFAAIPLIFSVQQFMEGWQWLAPHPSYCSSFTGYGFLFFAFLLWPTYIPLAVGQMEVDPKRKKMLRWFLFAGLPVSLGLLVILVTQPLGIHLLTRGIEYDIFIPWKEIGVFWYVAVVAGSFFVSSHRFLRWFGLAALFSAFVALWFYAQTFTSVWCYFAACLSLGVYFFFVQRKKIR